MYISELIKQLEEIKNQKGDCKIYYWDQFEMHHLPVEKIMYQNESDFREDLAVDEDYVCDFELIKNNVVIL